MQLMSYHFRITKIRAELATIPMEPSIFEVKATKMLFIFEWCRPAKIYHQMYFPCENWLVWMIVRKPSNFFFYLANERIPLFLQLNNNALSPWQHIVHTPCVSRTSFVVSTPMMAPLWSAKYYLKRQSYNMFSMFVWLPFVFRLFSNSLLPVVFRLFSTSLLSE